MKHATRSRTARGCLPVESASPRGDIPVASLLFWLEVSLKVRFAEPMAPVFHISPAAVG